MYFIKFSKMSVSIFVVCYDFVFIGFLEKKDLISFIPLVFTFSKALTPELTLTFFFFSPPDSTSSSFGTGLFSGIDNDAAIAALRSSSNFSKYSVNGEKLQ